MLLPCQIFFITEPADAHHNLQFKVTLSLGERDQQILVRGGILTYPAYFWV